MTSLDLFAKTELWVEGLVLDDVDLTALAASAADVLGLAREEVFVTDVRAGHVIFDVTARAVRLEDIAGREADLLARLARSPGVTVTPGASIHSHGVLGVIGAPAEQAGQIVAAAAAMEANLRAYVSRSVAVLSTGAEVARGEIEDTNYAAIAELLGAAGYNTTHAGVAEDDEEQDDEAGPGWAGPAAGAVGDAAVRKALRTEELRATVPPTAAQSDALGFLSANR